MTSYVGVRWIIYSLRIVIVSVNGYSVLFIELGTIHHTIYGWPPNQQDRKNNLLLLWFTKESWSIALLVKVRYHNGYPRNSAIYSAAAGRRGTVPRSLPRVICVEKLQASTAAWSSRRIYTRPLSEDPLCGCFQTVCAMGERVQYVSVSEVSKL